MTGDVRIGNWIKHYTHTNKTHKIQINWAYAIRELQISMRGNLMPKE